MKIDYILNQKKEKVHKYQNGNNTNSIIWHNVINLEINNKKILKELFT